MSLETSNRISVEDFAEGAARQFATFVSAGKIDAALATAKQLPDGVNTKGANGSTALELSIKRDDSNAAQLLLAAGAVPDGTPGRSPLDLAIDLNRPAIFKALLHAGADPNGDWNGEFCLMTAATYGRDEMIRALLDAGADINKRDEIGGTAIMQSAATDHFRIVLLLMERGATVWAATTAGGTLARLTETSRLLPDNPDGVAKLDVIRRLKTLGSPWPPPNGRQVKQLIAEGKWPPPGAK